MTNARIAPSQFVNRPSRNSRTASTFRLHLLMEERQRLEIGARIKMLRERSPFKQQKVAEKLKLGLRGYQKLEKVGTEDFERCEAIYKIHKDWIEADPSEWSHVSAAWIWDGRERNGDLMGSLSEAEEVPSLKRVEDQVAALETKLLSRLGEVQSELEDLLRSQAPRKRKRGGNDS